MGVSPGNKASPRLKTVGALLLNWFRKHGRSFPWRAERDPYAILVAEKLLQQTAAGKSVIDAYMTLLARYPTAVDLSRADTRMLKKIIQPLGLIYRASELRMLGRALVKEFDGKVPAEFRELISLPGVGDYAARAVLSFAYGKNVPVVDTNVARFLYRYFGIKDEFPSNPARKRSLVELADRLLPMGRSREFNFAILDLCAGICKSGLPLCGRCPVRSGCASARSESH